MATNDPPELIETVPAGALYGVLQEQAEDLPDATDEDDLLPDGMIVVTSSEPPPF